MKLRFLFILAASAALPLHAMETTGFNFGWQFARGPHPGAEAELYDASSWRTVNLPHDFQIEQPWVAPEKGDTGDRNNEMANVASRLSSRGFKEMGEGWYRKSFTPDPDWKGKRVLVDFEGIMLNGDVWLNGEPVGGTGYGYLGFECDITDKLKYGEPNVIAVRADTGIPENSRWYTGGGLYRDVNIKVGDPNQWFTRHALRIATPVVSPEKSSVTVCAEIANRLKTDSVTVGLEIIDRDGRIVYSAIRNHWNNRRQTVREFRLDSISLPGASLWDTDNPYLYTLRATLFRPDGSAADTVTERFGIRSVEFSPEYGLKLNGRKVLLKGIANHHTLGALGAAAYPAAIEKRVKLLKDFGFNHIRTSHNPYSESFLDICDEYGILVVDELYDKWTGQHCGGRTSWEERWQHDVPEWVRRDRNHPCVILWSFGNELQLIPDLPFNDWGVTPYRLQRELLKRYDTTRPTTVAMHPRGRNELTDSIPAPLALETDIAAYNYRYMYFPGDSRRYPGMIFYQSEANNSGMGPNWFDMDLDRVTGAAYWGMIDYLGESLGWPAKGWTQGVFDIALNPKPSAYFLRSIFKPEEPLVHIGIIDSDSNLMWNDVQVGTKGLSDHWNRRDGSLVDLYTYTTADEVELLVNGKSIGRRRNNVDSSRERNRIMWRGVPYARGYVEARAYRDGETRPVASHRVETAGDAVKLRLSADNPAWRADGTDLQHVKVEAVDSKGRVNPYASQKLTFSVDGPAEIAGVINGNMNSDELTTGNSRSLFGGNATVILRSSGVPGKVTLRVDAPGFKTVKQTFVTQ